MQKQVRIRILEPHQTDDFIRLVNLFEKVFEMDNFQMPDKNHLSKILNLSYFKAVIAEFDNKITGGATIYVLKQYYSIKPLAYIYDLAVLTEFQRQGIGRKIIEFIKDYCRSNGFEEAFVQADESDGYALNFYRTTNPTDEERVRHFNYSFIDSKNSTGNN